ncbi:sugar ABC transporter substrate-binding protein [Marinomonas sp. C2222]|uniref:Sugar ABC transporter substrate-binding protein n=1 Tax=Marinomonas sargassi TaxID=2984494 RepID=A0ABT2YW56_9GAMM|nr:sugar ABC transporter substrate-binding protein [Marinomonas sargassi]MCV2404136.1 sugar ABC transporter substrate-binding protein [Marinomonas sargassi]
MRTSFFKKYSGLLNTSLITLTSVVATNSQAVELNIATVNNGHMIEMQKLSKEFEASHPDIQLKWHVYNEGSLRMRAIADTTSGGGRYDVLTIGMYEAPIWAKRGWLQSLNFSSSYNVDDLLPSVREGLSYEGDLYAAPFYGESSMLMYRADLLAKANLSFDQRPSWQQVYDAAKKMHDPENQVYGICLRGKPGWGDNMALVSTMVNSFGGQWFDMDWAPQIDSQPWQEAVSFYVDLLSNYGPPDSHKNSFNEILSLSREGKCAMWIDASVAASFITNEEKSTYAKNWEFVQSPQAKTSAGANWLWAWSLAIPKNTKKPDAAKAFISWATSKEYIALVASKNGWKNIPTGTRTSTYQEQNFLSVAGSFAQAELEALRTANPDKSTLPPSPYSGIQFVPIPEFVPIAGNTGQKISEALEGNISVKDALFSSQKTAIREMKGTNY